MKIRRRGIWILVVLALMVATAGVTYFFARRVVSPRQAASIASSPTPSQLTAPLETRVVTQSLIASGVVEVPSNPLAIAIPDIPNGIPIITRSPPGAGSKLSPGQELAAISGQPIFVLHGSIPAYRDLGLGATGPDVTQLQLALNEVGFHIDANGIVGDATIDAVRSLYGRTGAALMASNSTGISESTAPSNLTSSEMSVTQQDSGVVIPRAAFVFTPFPATVAASSGGLGAPGSNLAVSLRAGPPQLQLDLEPEQANTVKSGVPVTATIGSAQVRGIVSAVQVTSGSGGTAGTATCTVRLTGGPTPQAGETADATLVLSSTHRPVLAAPVSAVHRSSSGQPVLQLVSANGAVRQVSIEVSTIGDGYVAISGPAATELRAGTEVSLQW